MEGCEQAPTKRPAPHVSSALDDEEGEVAWPPRTSKPRMTHTMPSWLTTDAQPTKPRNPMAPVHRPRTTDEASTQPQRHARSSWRVQHRGTHPRPPSPSQSTDFDDEGYASLYSTDSEELSETEQGRMTATSTLGPLAARRFRAMLRSLTMRRERIARCMMFALDHATWADAVSEMLAHSLMQPSTPVARKLARLYVLSDILCNSDAPVPHAWRYRETFTAWLPRILHHFGEVIHAFPGRIKADRIQREVRAVLDVWEARLLFPPPVLAQWAEALTLHATKIQPTNQTEVDHA